MARIKSEISFDQLENLRKAVLKRFKKILQSPAHFTSLKEHVFQKTGHMISSSTLMRFMGTVTSRSLPSAHTLEVISDYTGTPFQGPMGKDPIRDLQGNLPQVVGQFWEHALHSSRKVSEYTLLELRKRSGLDFDHTISRDFADDHIRSFLDSGYQATAFIAPGGYGKSIMIAHAVESLINETDGADNKNIIWFLSATNLGALFQKGFDLENWISAQFGFGKTVSFLGYLHEHPGHRKGKVLIVIDGFDEISFNINKLEELFRQITSLLCIFGQNNWFKVIFTCRAQTWKQYLLPLIHTTNTSHIWYHVPLNPFQEDEYNVPLLTAGELQKIVSNHAGQILPEKYALFGESENLMLRIPYFLQLHLKIKETENDHHASELDLLLNYLNQVVYNHASADEMIEITDLILTSCNLGKSSKSVPKKQLKSVIDRYIKSYFHLVNEGILNETKARNKFGTSTTMVSFRHNNLFELFLVLHLIETFNGVNHALFNHVYVEYSRNELRPFLIRWIILFAFHLKKYDVIKSIYLESFENGEPFDDLTYFRYSKIVLMQLRNNHHAVSKLFPAFARNPKTRFYLLEHAPDYDFLNRSYGGIVNLYLRNSESPASLLFGNCLLYLGAFLNMDEEECQSRIARINAIKLNPVFHPFLIGRYFACNILHCQHYLHIKDNSLLSQMFEYEKLMPRRGDDFRDFPVFHYTVCDALNMCGYYTEAEKLLAIAYRDYNLEDSAKRLWPVSALHTLSAVAYCGLNDEKKCRDRLQMINPLNFPIERRIYYTIQYNLVLAKLNIIEGKTSEATDLLSRVISDAGNSNFSYFSGQATDLMQTIS